MIMAIARVWAEAMSIEIQLNHLQCLLDYLLSIVHMLEMKVHTLVQIVNIVIELLKNGQLSIVFNFLLVLN